MGGYIETPSTVFRAWPGDRVRDRLADNPKKIHPPSSTLSGLVSLMELQLMRFCRRVRGPFKRMQPRLVTIFPRPFIRFEQGGVRMFGSFKFCATFSLLMIALIYPSFVSSEPLIIGSVHREAAAEVQKFLPLANFLGKQLQPEGINEVRTVVAQDISQMGTLLRNGKVDLYIDSPFLSVAASVHSGSKFLLRRWKRGRAEYRSVIFAKKDSNLHRLEDLKGNVLAFEEPFSSSGYLLPKMALAQEGLKLVPVKTRPSR